MAIETQLERTKKEHVLSGACLPITLPTGFLGSANLTLRLRTATRLLPFSNTAVRYIYAVEKISVILH